MMPAKYEVMWVVGKGSPSRPEKNFNFMMQPGDFCTHVSPAQIACARLLSEKHKMALIVKGGIRKEMQNGPASIDAHGS